ncbi:hypothetical protein [Thalassotalea crassostreae]|uniref:hypothetical protein n=1 Tax=Thalassotalea crassostreae TaxID=1763536 RepID=UPI000838DAFF|nr:hypothetical protein [Thalassotalea crassostreae]
MNIINKQPALTLHAGQSALAMIKEKGLSNELFKLIVGASGGPKWFVLAGLDRYFCGEYFQQRNNNPLYTLGSSAGAWRFSCYGQNEPLKAINRLIEGYSGLSYPANANIQQITAQSEQLLAYVLGEQNGADIVANKQVKSSVVVAKSLGLTRFEHKALQLPGLITSAAANRISRRHLGKYYQRVIFSNDVDYIPFDYHDGIGSKVVALESANISQALQATGSIPLLINGVKNIKGAGNGMYRDGGIIDYHFDQQFLPEQDDGLVLYPHFYNEFKPGWFDKYIKSRFANKEHFDNTLILCPSAEFVQSLPYQKIPDRKDFAELTETQRQNYFRTVASESERLADEFNELVNGNQSTDIIRSL